MLRSKTKNPYSSELYIILETDTTLVVGLVHYRHRNDKQTTLYSIAVKQDFRGMGLGKRLLRTLVQQSLKKGQTHVLLKCPQELEANNFYQAYGFECITVESGKKRPLNVWKLML